MNHYNFNWDVHHTSRSHQPPDSLQPCQSSTCPTSPKPKNPSPRPQATSDGHVVVPRKQELPLQARDCFFLDWLLRARGRGRFAGKRVELETFSDVVQEIAMDPSTLTPKLLQELPKALAACQCAITLRERVATFFAEDDEAQDGYQHFLQLLRSWRDALKDIGVEQSGPVEQMTKCKNYYAVLEVDEDFFPDEQTFVTDRGATKKAKTKRKKLFEEAFAQDVQMEVVCYYMELEELVGGVFNIYSEVKQQKRSMMEATVVGTLALHMANALTAKLQLRYPELKLAEDLVGVLVCYPSASLGTQIEKAVAEARESFEKDGTAKFVPGTLLHDFTNVWVTLSIYSSVFPPLEQTMLIGSPEGYFGENYGEERTPEHVFPDVNHCVVLLSQQLPYLYNAILVKRTFMGRGLDGQKGLVVDFMNLLEEYFETRQVTIPLVFLCICWMQSVVALQGDAGLSRNISFTIKHTEDLITILETAMSKNPLPLPVKGDSYHALLRDIRNGHKASLRTNKLARANSLFAGSQMISNHLEYLIVGSGYIAPMCRAFCHLYNALVKEGFLEHIQVIDEMLDIYGEMIFRSSSREAAVRGSYNRVYLLACNRTGTYINAMYEGGPIMGKYRGSEKQLAGPNMMSLTYRLMHDDMSFLKGVASKTMLQKAADVCMKEMFESRILSRDLMTLNDDVEEVFSAICEALGRQEIRDRYVASVTEGANHEVMLKRALECTVMLPLISIVDGLRPDGSLDWSVMPRDLQVIGDVDVNGDFVRRMLRIVAIIIESRFTSQICEQKYYTFPSRPDFVNQQFGLWSFKAKTKNTNRERVFYDLMSLLQDSNGPLGEKELSHLKEEIKKDPELLSIFLPNLISNALTEYNDLCTLFHQAAAGPAHDAKLVEWLIQMGALFTQPLHCRKEPRERDLQCPRKLLPNTMAVHSAAIAGYADIMMLILEADNFVDLNTPPFHTKETLAHLVVKNGHKSPYYGINTSGADMRIKDGNGRNMWDMTSDQKWALEIAEVAARIENDSKRGRARKEPPKLTEGILVLLAERKRKLVFAKRKKDLSLAMADLDVYDDVEPKKKTKTETKKSESKKVVKSNVVPISRTHPVPKVDTSTTTKLVAALLGAAYPAPTSKTGSPNGSSRNAILQAQLQKTMAAFSRLRDSSIPAEDKVEDIERICKILHKLDEATEVQSDPNKMIGTGVVLRIDVS